MADPVGTSNVLEQAAPGIHSNHGGKEQEWVTLRAWLPIVVWMPKEHVVGIVPTVHGRSLTHSFANRRVAIITRYAASSLHLDTLVAYSHYSNSRAILSLLESRPAIPPAVRCSGDVTKNLHILFNSQHSISSSSATGVPDPDGPPNPTKRGRCQENPHLPLPGKNTSLKQRSPNTQAARSAVLSSRAGRTQSPGSVEPAQKKRAANSDGSNRTRLQIGAVPAPGRTGSSVVLLWVACGNICMGLHSPGGVGDMHWVSSPQHESRCLM